MVTTCALDGTPNVSLLSQVYFVDRRHVALSCQFFNKTRRNLDENPRACLQVIDPLTLQAYRLDIRFDHSETEGPLFETMALRIRTIASHTGMDGVFGLRSADVCEVLSVERVEGHLTTDAAADEEGEPGRHSSTDLVGLELVSRRVNHATSLDDLLTSTLEALDASFGFGHSLLLLPDDTGERLLTIASCGYGESGVGAEIRVGEGLIGTVAEQRRPLRVCGMEADLRYGRAVRRRLLETEGEDHLRPEIPLPGLVDAKSQIAVPLLLLDRLVGVLALESASTLAFEEWHQTYLQVIANQLAIAIDAMLSHDDEGVHDDPAEAPRDRPSREPLTRRFVFYRNDDCVFVDGEYLIRNVPGKILWKLLSAYEGDGRTEFTNRELRLDPTLGLPPVRHNLESRLILLRRRLEQKCPEVAVVPTGRGRFHLEVACQITLESRETG